MIDDLESLDAESEISKINDLDDLVASIDYSEEIYIELQQINQTLHGLLFLIASIFLYSYIKSIWRVKGR